MDENENEITEEREEVAEEATPETDEEATEQRTDDYDGIVRRIDDLATSVADRLDSIERMIEALGVSAVEGELDGDAVAAAAGEAAAEVVDELLGIDSMDLL
jgi:hypothetical protein